MSISRPVIPSTVTLLGVFLTSGLASAASFTFPDAEFMQDDAGMRAARSFVEHKLVPGLPMREAINRVQKAQASCHIPESRDAPVTCEYFIVARPVGGDLGENIWTVQLFPRSDGALKDATVARTRVGMPGYPAMTATLPSVM